MKRFHKYQNGSALMISVFMILIMMVGSVMFMKKANISLSGIYLTNDSLDARYALDSALELEDAKIETILDGINLINKLVFFDDGPATESFVDIQATYAQDTAGAIKFLEHVIVLQAMDENGNIDDSHEFSTFEKAFPTSFTDRDLEDNIYYEADYEIVPSTPVIEIGYNSQIKFRYEIISKLRAYGSTQFSKKSLQKSEVIEIAVRGAPFSQFALFRATNQNQNGWLLVFAGGESSSEVRERFYGPVHMNAIPHFYGAPQFYGSFSSIAVEADWWQGDGSGYSGEAVFNDDKMDEVPAIDMPTEVFNFVRMAAGDTSSDASVDPDPVTEAELGGFVNEYAGGTLADPSVVPDGIYVPINNQISKEATGGVYVQGDADVVLNVVQGNSEIPGDYWSNIQASHQSCKFQKIGINNTTAGVQRDIFIGDDPCEVTYVFDAASPANAPAIVQGRLNGNIHVEGAINSLGGESRTKPAVAQDFGLNVSARRTIKIENDIQYEDAYYVASNGDGTASDTVVAGPTGELNGSGAAPTDPDILPIISEDSQTVIGIMSTHGNVMIHDDAPANINVHAALYAGNSASYDEVSGDGCGTSGASTAGCGFGYEGWDDKTGMGSFKFLGSISEYKSQTLGRLVSPPTGYQRRMQYDERFLKDLTPPGFPLSANLEAYVTRKTFRTIRLGMAN